MIFLTRVRARVCVYERLFPFLNSFSLFEFIEELEDVEPIYDNDCHKDTQGPVGRPFFLSCLLFSTKLRTFKNILLFSVSFLVLFLVVHLYANGWHIYVKSANIC